jgi:hypothetical protein
VTSTRPLLSIGRSLRRLALAVLIVAAAIACSPLRRGPSAAPATLIFTNESLDQATVYVVVPGFEFRRIGTVMAGRTETLRVPAELAARAGTVNVVARMLARSDVPQTGPVSIRPGEQYELRLPITGRLISFLPSEP